MKYLVAIKVNRDSEIFTFETDKDRQDFIEDIDKDYPNLEYATSEIDE